MRKVLVIEDENSIRENIEDILTLNNYDVISADNGYDGVQKAFDEIPEIILCDIMMRGMNGYEVLEKIKADDRFIFTPFIFISAKSDPEDIRKGMNMGADDYLSKPFSIDDFQLLINKRLEKSSQLKNYYQNKNKEINNVYKNINIHEFNTPMNGILTATSILKETHLATSVQADLVNMIWISSTRLHRNLSNISFYHQIDENKYQPYIETIRFSNIIILVDEITKKIHRENDIKFNIDSDFSEFKSDRKLFEYIITELLDNAYKFTKSGVPVGLNISYKAHQLHLDCFYQNQTNFSIEKFENHYAYLQYDKNENEQNGLGLGLPIIKKAIQKLNGTFVLTLPDENHCLFKVQIPN